ncbi:MAG: CoA transferase, partial [Clostridiales Family XIII bacterium]|nr:CoA transferase [Clostridiales Family XIII bacterium]
MSLLEGIKVVEFTTRAAGSVCGRILADRKADVIKVEPIGGEAFRAWEACPGAPTQEDENPLFELGNANKRGLAIDATTEDGKKIMFRLLERADVFLTNYSEKELAGLRLDRDTLSERYPRLICGYL